jgi:UDP-GlcNAc:undecaprenyl-phosphate GlcNAc-1-phosphate transferase
VAAFAWIALLAWHAGSGPIATEAFLLLCAVAGFLVFNMRHRWRSRAAVYMGDMGSMMLGAALACFIVLLSSGDSHASFPTLAWIVVIPVTDTLVLILRRVADGRNPLRPDRQHLHHLLLDSGFSPMATMAIIVMAGFVCGGVGYAGYVFAVPSGWMCAGLLVPVGLHAGFVLLLTGTFRRLRRLAGAALPPIAASLRPVERGRS